MHIYVTILNYITNAPCFGASTQSSGSFDIVFAVVFYHTTTCCFMRF